MNSSQGEMGRKRKTNFAEQRRVLSLGLLQNEIWTNRHSVQMIVGKLLLLAVASEEENWL